MWKVLLVEDEVFVRESIREIIRWEEMGFTLTGEAGDGLEALSLIKENPPDLVLTDIIMPRMDGIELLKEARMAGCTSKFVMLTCMGDFEYMRQAMEFGASNYILKLSMSVKDLRETLLKINVELQKAKAVEPSVVAATIPFDKTPHPEVRKILLYIEENYAKDISVKSLSQYVMMGENYVSALFKKKTGQTLISYLHEYRIVKATEYLMQTDLTVTDIGERVGFMNDNYFIKIFKRITGTTPSQYRKR
ncbi:response regulator [Paenibacillus sp. 2TAB23]|uniref:response regulator n=1 Tax=Paenibacillus sp. 2TAB23 TaxID=3233004 RepID=UPI003F99B99D